VLFHCPAPSPPLSLFLAGTTANTLNLAGPSDGGAGCMGQQTLSGAFTLSDPLSAYAYLNFVPVLIQLQTENTHEWLQLNSTRSGTLRADSKAAAGLSQPER